MEYTAQAAKDAQKAQYGNKGYWDMLEQSAIEHREYFLRKGDHAKAQLMMTQSLSEALMGNNGL